MALKDTQKALISRGINDETAILLAKEFGSMSKISEKSVDDLVAIGLDAENAGAVLGKLSTVRRRSSSSSGSSSSGSKKKGKASEPAAEPHYEIVKFTRDRPESDTEIQLKALAAENGIDKLPLKVYVDIAERLNAHPDHVVTEEQRLALLTKAQEMFLHHQMDKNESAGIMAAHSIGEPGTQMNLRTFHFAGDSFVSVTKGLPRLIEIVDARTEPSTPSMTVPLTGLAKEDEAIARRIASKIETTTLSNVADIEIDVTNLQLIIRPTPEVLVEKGISFSDIVEKLGKIKVVKDQISEDGFSITLTCPSDNPSFKTLQQMYDSIRNAKISGIDGIKQAFIKKEEIDGKLYFTIITDGSNLKEILKEEMVDAAHVKTNSICEVASVLGIEAARNAIVEEAYSTLEEAGLNVDVRHIMMVADVMTNDGVVRAIGRHGISGKKSSVLARAAFEITAAHLLHAAIIGEVDGLEGVTENIIVGQPVTLGTGAVHLKYDPSNPAVQEALAVKKEELRAREERELAERLAAEDSSAEEE